MRRRHVTPADLTPVHRIVGAVVGFAFAGIGVILIGWLWFQPFGFMHPPLMFRLFGSMIAIVFAAVGGSIGVAALRGGGVPHSLKDHFSRVTKAEKQAGYKCANCGGGLSDASEVSPSGDVKCDYCGMWFNIHR